MSLTYTTFNSKNPPAMTKTFSIGKDDALCKTTVCNMATGSATRSSAADLNELATQLDALQSHQAVGWGVPTAETVGITVQGREEPDFGVVSRTRRFFSFCPGPGVLMLDHDESPIGPLDCDALRRQLIGACPALADAPMLWRPSSSAGLRNRHGRELTGLHRHRLYVPVTNAPDIPEAGKRLVKLLQAADLGWFAVGRAGQALRRCLVDDSVWQPERIDFAAPPILKSGIQRPTETARVFGDPAGLFDLSLIKVSPEQEREAGKRMKVARAAVRDACAASRERWATEKAPELAEKRGITVEKAHEILTRASERAVLMGDFLLTSSEGKPVSVGEVLDNPTRWHNTRFADPLEPDDDLRVALVNLYSGARPFLWTHRHGGIRFELRRQSARVQVGRGMRVSATDSVLQVLRDRGELFDFGEGACAYVAGGRARTVSRDWLTDHMGRVCDFYGAKTLPSGEPVEYPDDAPPDVARAIMAKNGERGFLPLVSVVTAPTLRADGSVLDQPGYDAASMLLYYSEDPNPPRVPTRPTPADALQALRFLWGPVALFPLVDDLARGVVLQGLLTSAIRAALPTAPGVGLDAPAAGTGKTLIGKCFGILADGKEPAVLPPVTEDEEVRKRLFAELRSGSRVLLWDNVRDPLGSAALDAFLTGPTFRDRVLGVSESASLPNRAMFVATGNNLRMVGDTCRRIFVARLDAQTEKPYARDFDFDPVQRVLADRAAYCVAALTIIRAYIVAGRPKAAPGRTASFEAWDDLVRQPVCWLASLVQASGDPSLPRLEDPLNAAERGFDSDPETTKLKALLHAWKAAFGLAPTTVAAAVRRSETDDVLQAALEEIGGQGSRINTRIVGRWIERHVGRRLDGLHIERGRMSRGLTTWVLKSDPDCARATGNQYTNPTKPTPPDRSEPDEGGRDRPARGGSGVRGGSISGRCAEKSLLAGADAEVI